MDFLARLDDSSRKSRKLSTEERRNLAQIKLEVCAPYVGYRITRQPAVTWSNGRTITRGFLELNHPNGRIAKSRTGEWYYPSGKRAKTGLGTWKYANGMLARTKDGIWYTDDGTYVEDPEKAKREACEYLGKQLCPLGKADEDLLTITVMGLINLPKDEVEKETESKPAEPGPDSP